MWREVKRIGRIERPEGLLFLKCVVLLSAIRMAFFASKPRVVRGWLRRAMHAIGWPAGDRIHSAATLLWAVNAAEKYAPTGSTCLAAALLGKTLLEEYGYEAQLRIGVKREPDGKFLAHAWLVREGKIVVGGPPAAVQNYTVMPDVERLFS
jgi:hypothetical protein